jgi:hypothetical protein
MSYSASTLLTRNLPDVFGENDPERRCAGHRRDFHRGLRVLQAQGRIVSLEGHVCSSHQG